MEAGEAHDWLAARFEAHREHLRGVAYRMLGSLSEADDAVQEAWLRLGRAGADDVGNLGGWLTTVVARICLDMLRSRESRREESLDETAAAAASGQMVSRDARSNPEQEAVLADAVGLAMLVVLERLDPAERIAFVLHDMFDVPFDEIAGMVGRTPAAARQLASRARRRVRGPDRRVEGDGDVASHRVVVERFITALRAGDFTALLAVLDPDLVVSADAAIARSGAPREIRGASAWAGQAVAYGRGMRFARAALIDGAVGIVLAPRGRLTRALRVTVAGGRVSRLEIIAEPATLQALDVRPFAEGARTP